MKTFTSLYKNYITPHIQVYYDSFVKNNTNFTLVECIDGQLVYILEKYMHGTNDMLLKCILFQIIYTLYVIRRKTGYKNFNHNNLTINNIGVKVVNYEANSYTKYIVGKQEYLLPNVGFYAKIQHFYKATDSSLYNKTHKQSCDILTLLKTILKLKYLNKTIINWCENMIKLFIDEYGDKKYCKFLKFLLNDKIFHEFKNNKKDSILIYPIFKC